MGFSGSWVVLAPDRHGSNHLHHLISPPRNASNQRNEPGRDGSSSSSPLLARASFGTLEKIKEEPEIEEDEEMNGFVKHSGHLKALKKGSCNRKSIFSFKFGRGEHVAAGWAAWLSDVAAEAIDGWLPLKSDTFQRLEKIGQGTYSDVYRARNVETGKMVAVKRLSNCIRSSKFKLCGSPADEYWRRCKLPLASMFKPQHPYESTLHERCKEFPKSAVSLIETFLSIEPYKHETASSALDCKYFNTKPYACDPSSFPKYPPNKEIDAKFREEVRRKKASATSRAQSGSRYPRRVHKSLQESNDFFKVAPPEGVGPNHVASRKHGGSANVVYKRRGAIGSRTSLKQSYDTLFEASQMTKESQVSTTHSVPMQMSTSSGFEWNKKHKHHEMFSRLHGALDPPNVLRRHYTFDLDGEENDEFLGRVRGKENSNCAMHRERVHLHQPDSFDSDVYMSLMNYHCLYIRATVDGG